MNKAHIRQGRYHWKAGVHLPVKAQDFGDWVMSLPDQQPATIVDAARDPRAVAHSLFNWDDVQAAHQHRLSIARRLYGCLVVEAVTYQRDKPKVYHVRAIVRGGRDEPYEPIANVMSEPAKRDYMLAQCLVELQRLRREYAALSELAVVFAAIDSATKTTTKRKRRVR
jgi:hypothetical protein